MPKFRVSIVADDLTGACDATRAGLSADVVLGTAFDLAGTGAASAESLGAAYDLACAFAAHARRTM